MKEKIEQIKARIEKNFLDNGYEATYYLNSPEAFGSQYVTHRKGDKSIRLVWDGKDPYISLDTRLNDNNRDSASWKNLVTIFVKQETDLAEVETDLLQTLAQNL